jgi:predicted RNase H-like nuclease
MSETSTDVWLAGVDGCRAGWIAAFVRPAGDDGSLAVFARFIDVLGAAPAPAIVAVDIPIGLPERGGHGGRAAENFVRPLLGRRQSSVFSIPSRAAVYATDYLSACRAAIASSDPPRKVSKQLFNIAPKIREVDAVLRNEGGLIERVYEVHPELAFWRLNGERPLDQPKKVKGAPFEPGLTLRRKLLKAAGLPAALVAARAPQGAADDDVVDALACATIARRLRVGLAQPFPDPPPRDRYGLPMAIWA